MYQKGARRTLVGRDQLRIKPLLYQFDDDKFVFGSEMKSILAYGVEKNIDYSSLYLYLQLNYIPGPDSILTTIKKLQPGHYIKLTRGKIEVRNYYDIPRQQLS